MAGRCDSYLRMSPKVGRREPRKSRAMIDLHCHILPGVDDGPPDSQASLELAEAAATAGTRTIAATPHIREDHPFDHATIPWKVDRLNAQLRAAGLEVDVVRGGEIALSILPQLDDAALKELTLG